MTNHIDKRIYRLLISHGFYGCTRILNNVFLSLYIWNLSSGFQPLAIYFSSYLFFHSLFFHLWGYVVKHGHTHIVRLVGLVGMLGFYGFLLFVRQDAINHLVLLGLLHGIFGSMYWLTYHVLVFDSTHTKNRANYLGMENAMSIIVNVATPLIGGFLVTLNLFGLGYETVFALSGLSVLAAIIIGYVTPPKTYCGHLHMRETWNLVRKEKDLLKVFAAQFFSNVGYRGSLDKILLFLLFDVLQKEFTLGGWLAVFSAVAVFSSWYIGKHLSPDKYRTAIIYSGILMFASFFALIGIPHIVTYITFSIVKEVLTPFIRIPRQVYGRNLIHILNNHNKHRIEFFIIREWFGIGFGRMFSYLLLLPIATLDGPNLKIVLIFMALSMVVAPYILSRIKTDLKTV